MHQDKVEKKSVKLDESAQIGEQEKREKQLLLRPETHGNHAK